MRHGSVIFLNICSIAALLCAGCRTIVRTGPDSSPLDDDLMVAHDQEALAEALANFSIGLILDGMSDDEALAHYAAAAELEPESLSAHLGMASYHIKRGQMDQAAEVMEQCCARNPGSGKARLYLSSLYQTLKRLDDAERTILEAIELNPRDSVAYFRLSSIHAGRGDKKRELAVLEEAIGKVDDILPILRHLGDLHTRAIHSADPEEAVSQLDQAIFFYSEAAQQPFDNLTPDYLHRLGDLYIMKRDLPKAAEILERLSVSTPDDIQVHKKLALCYMALDDKDRAITSLTKVVTGEPDNAEVYCYLGELYEAMDDRENAAKHYNMATGISGVNPLPYLQLARMYIGEDPEKASAALLKGLEKLPGNTELLNLLSRTYLMAGNDEEAIGAFDSLIGIVEADDSSIINAGQFLDFGMAAHRAGMSDKAAAYYSRGIEIDPSITDLHVGLASLLMDQGRSDDAIAVMKEAVAIVPDEPDARYYLALIFYNNRLFAEAAEEFAQVEALALRHRGISLNAEFFFHYGAALERTGNLEKAEQMLARSIALDSNNPEALNYLAYMWTERGINLDIALEYVGHALELDPDNGAFIDTLGWIYYMKGNYGLALDHVENALFFMPGDPTIAEHLGDILEALGRDAEAAEWWTFSFSVNPSNEAVAKKLRNAGVDLDSLLPAASPAAED